MPSPETVAEDTFRVALLARILAPFLNANPEKVTTSEKSPPPGKP
jgi:5'-deoxynucleotidase YfbR-like HD superfamily hydrolase